MSSLMTEKEAAEQLRISGARLAKIARAKQITCVMVTPTVRCYRRWTARSAAELQHAIEQLGPYTEKVWVCAWPTDVVHPSGLTHRTMTARRTGSSNNAAGYMASDHLCQLVPLEPSR